MSVSVSTSLALVSTPHIALSGDPWYIRHKFSPDSHYLIDVAFMDRLPYEITRDVFLKALPYQFSHSSQQDELSAQTVRTPLYISHVCRSWRDFALSYGELWSNLFLETRSWHTHGRRAADTEIFFTWLSRTRDAPINFRVIIDLRKSYGEHQWIAEKFIRALLSQQRRWRNVEFDWRNWSPFSIFPRIYASDMPQLVAFSFTYNTCCREDPSALIDISRSRRLARLQLNGRVILEFGKEPIYTLRSMEHWSTAPTTPRFISRIVDFLKVTPSLEAFSCSSSFPPDDAPILAQSQDDKMVLNIRDLRIDLLHTSGHFFNQITLPSLRSLSYKYGLSTTGEDPLLKFIQRSPSMILQELELDLQYWASERTLTETLRLLPGLSHLRIQYLNPASPVLEMLTITSKSSAEDDKPLCPNLQSFSISFRSPRNENDQLSRFHPLIRMVESRINVKGTLRRTGYWEDFVDLDKPNVNWSGILLGKGGGLRYVNFFGCTHSRVLFGLTGRSRMIYDSDL